MRGEIVAWNDQEWKVRAPDGACSVCGRDYADGEEFVSQLLFVEGEGYARRDRCVPCLPAETSGVISTWHTQYRAPAPPAEAPVKRETAESLLRQLVELGRPDDINLAYVLAVMLERQRLLVERDVQTMEDGALRRVYEHRKTGEIWIIVDPQIRLADLERIQTEVVARLGGEAPSTPPTPPESAAPAPTAEESPSCST
jgi:hypothetical protein